MLNKYSNMSALLDNKEHNKLNLFTNVGYNTRFFTNSVHYSLIKHVDSCLFIKYNSPCKLVNRAGLDYRNHFKLYTSDSSILIVRIETTLQIKDTNVIIDYELITPNDSLCVNHDIWDISFDKITYKKIKPSNVELKDFQLRYFGEWWYFDHGIILNGLSTVIEEHTTCNYALIYYELYNKFETVEKKLVSITPALSVNFNDLVTADNNVDPPEETPKSISSLMLVSIIPSPNWFIDRKKELLKNNITYFLPGTI